MINIRFTNIYTRCMNWDEPLGTNDCQMDIWMSVHVSNVYFNLTQKITCWYHCKGNTFLLIHNYTVPYINLNELSNTTLITVLSFRLIAYLLWRKRSCRQSQLSFREGTSEENVSNNIWNLAGACQKSSYFLMNKLKADNCSCQSRFVGT